eukprot:605115_1
MAQREGGVNRQSSTSSTSNNPWGVSLNRLSFKAQPTTVKNASSKNPYNYISSPKTKDKKPNANTTKQKTKPKAKTSKPKTKAKTQNSSAKQRKTKSKSKGKGSRNSLKMSHDDDMPPLPAEVNDSKTDDKPDKQTPIERAKKRKMRRQLSLAKMQMSVLKARLGLEQMKSPRTIHEDVLDNAYEDIPDTANGHTNDNDSIDQDHSRSASVTTENLFATIESMGTFETDIRNAIQKVDDLMHQVNDKKAMEDTASLKQENDKLKQELAEITKKLKTLESQNSELKSKLDGKKAVNLPKKVVAAQMKADPLEKYSKMKDLGMPIDKIVAKMEKAQVDAAQIEAWKKKQSSGQADQVLASKVNAKEQLYCKYDKMKKMGMPNASIRGRMRMDGFKEEEMDRYLNGGAAAAPANEEDEFKKKMAKYDRMKKMGMPQHVIENKMRLDGISQEEQNKYFNPPKEGDKAAEKKVENVAKYERMKKMGMPMHAIVNKMRLDGLSADTIDAFEHPNKQKEAKGVDPRLAKYERMKKMGMPMHAIVNKMRLDGIEQSVVYKFEHAEEESEESEDEDDPNVANKINLNIPALKKYNRMKKMGMPMDAIVNKMKLDGIDANIVNAFEHPEEVGKKKSKKKGGFGGLFHKRKASIPAKEKIKPSVDMKRFHWQTVDYKLARNSIWKTMDEKNVTETMDTSEFESLFRIPKKENKIKQLLKKDKNSEKKKDEEIKFVSAKRQYNVELLLKRLKFDGVKLCSDIISMNEDALSLDTLIKLSDMVPTDEEQMQAIGMSNKHDKKRVAKYGIVERFFYDLSSVWSIRERIKLWIFKKEFAEICQHQEDKIQLLNKGLSDIQGSEGLYEAFKIILAFGNYMNGGRRNGQAYGFSLETLRMLSGTKGTDGRTTLLMYIYKYTKAENVCNEMMKELENVCAAVKIDIDALDKKIREVENELNQLPKRLGEFKKHNAKVKGDVYVAQMSEWLKTAQSMMHELKQSGEEMRKRATALAQTYAYELGGEDGKAINEFLSIFDAFIKDWNKAKIKYTKQEEKRKKDERRAKKKEEAQAKLQAKLSKRKVKRKDLEVKGIFKDDAKVKQQEVINAKLKKTLKAHVRKQTVMKQMFGDVLNQSDEEEEEEEEEEATDNTYQQYANAKTQSFNPDIAANDEPQIEANDEPKLSAKDKKKSDKKLKFAFRGKKKAHSKKDVEKQHPKGPLYKKQQHAVPAASQFGNVWELNFSPMSRSAYSQSKATKKKKTKYKSGHVRRETRLKKAFESMSEFDPNAAPDQEDKPKTKASKMVSVTSPKSRGNQIYSKYKRKDKKKAKANTMQMEF